MEPHIKTNFTGGEIAPSLYGRTDLAKVSAGCTTLRNFFTSYRGGAYSRAGYRYVGRCKQAGTSNPPRLIPFQFSLNQGYSLEFGEAYMRIVYLGAYVTEEDNAITGITQDTPGVFTYTNTNYDLANGDWIYVTGVGGMTAFNGQIWIVQGVSGSNFHVTDLFGNVINTVLFNPYTSGGTLARIYTVTSPYAAVDLPYLKFTQSQDTMSLTCRNQDTGTEYPPYDLVRHGQTDWTFTQAAFGTSIVAPSGVTVTATNSTTKDTYYSYCVTAVDAVTGQESVPSTPASVFNNNISVNAGSNAIKWTSVPNAGNYRIYAAVPSYNQDVAIGVNYGFIGTSFSTQFTDSNIVADFSTSPPAHIDPFARGEITSVQVTAGGSGYTQGTIGYAITTSAGIGFVGTPIVVAGALAGFVVINGGSGYGANDAMAITASNTTASGTYTFTTNPANKKNIRLDGVSWSFTTGTASRTSTHIGASITETLANLVADLNASNDKHISLATYSVSGSILTITYKTSGAKGNSYTLAAGSYGGSVSGANLTGGADGAGGAGGTVNLSIGAQTGTYPGSCCYDQQRRVYANTTNQPDTYFMSKPGAYLNFDYSTPTIDSDAITGTPWSQQVNGIQFMQPMTNGLVTLTGSGAWLVNGGNATAITPADQTAAFQVYNGCNAIMPPIVVNADIFYVQTKGSIVRDLAYSFILNGYTGTDVTVLSSHLFSYHQMYQWAYAEEPYKVIWATRDDGIMLSFTVLKEQEVMAWARHDTNGFFVSVCSVTEPPVDAVYVIVKRYVNGSWVYYTERADNRNWQNVEDAFCVDSGLRYPMTYPAATLTASAADGTKNITSVVMISGGSGYTAPIIEAIDATGAGKDASFTATVVGGVITSITVVTEGEGYIPGQTTITITDRTGDGAMASAVIENNITFTASSGVFSASDVDSVIRIGNSNAAAQNLGVTISGGGKAQITEYVSSTEVIANVLDPITAVIPNDPNETPVPAISGQWSISVPTDTVTGLGHLEGMTVSAVADGGVVPNLTVLDGSVTLPEEASSIVVGLPFTAQLQTTYLEAPGQPTIQGKRKDIFSVNVRVEASRGIEVGSNQPDQATQPNNAVIPWTEMILIKERNNLTNAGKAVPLYTGDHYINIPADWNVYGQIAIQQSNPLPANILALVGFYKVGDTSDKE